MGLITHIPSALRHALENLRDSRSQPPYQATQHTPSTFSYPHSSFLHNFIFPTYPSFNIPPKAAPDQARQAGKQAFFSLHPPFIISFCLARLSHKDTWSQSYIIPGGVYRNTTRKIGKSAYTKIGQNGRKLWHWRSSNSHTGMVYWGLLGHICTCLYSTKIDIWKALFLLLKYFLRIILCDWCLL